MSKFCSLQRCSEEMAAWCKLWLPSHCMVSTLNFTDFLLLLNGTDRMIRVSHRLMVCKLPKIVPDKYNLINKKSGPFYFLNASVTLPWSSHWILAYSKIWTSGKSKRQQCTWRIQPSEKVRELPKTRNTMSTHWEYKLLWSINNTFEFLWGKLKHETRHAS